VFTCGAAGQVRFVLLAGTRILQVLKDHPGNQWSVQKVDAVSLRDVNQDGIADLIVIVSAMSGIGPEGAHDFPAAGFWLGTKSGTFRTDPKALKILPYHRRITVRSVVRMLRHYYGQRKQTP